ncbi:MAG: 3-hydroxyacyl-CoA dehydrogenase NAD-binding domain-containing protein [Verrucomicrobiota bacterium]
MNTTSSTPETVTLHKVETSPNHVHHHVESPSCHLVTFDRSGSSANIFDAAALTELDHLLTVLQDLPPTTRVIFSSAKPRIFIAGADLKSLQAALQANDSDAEIEHYLQLGQSVFQKIAELPATTIAAIHGACVGGGFEMTLACDYRFASDDKATKIGLPETQLGILPAWGGSTRLPRMIGTPKALTVILKGKPYPAKRAKKLGIVDRIVPKEYLLDVARKADVRAKHRNLQWHKHNPIVTRIACQVARRKIPARTLQHYPALDTAIKTIRKAAHGSVESGYAEERQAFLKLAHTVTSKQLIRLFFLRESAGKANRKLTVNLTPIQRTAVVGAGIMGTGIAYWLSARSYPVYWNDIAVEAISRGMKHLNNEYQKAVKRRIMTRHKAAQGLNRVYPRCGMPQTKAADLVIEAAVEKMELKKRIFRGLDESSSPDTILATNTSALSVTELAEGLQHPERVIGLHFFNPVSRMPLVEVIAGDRTNDRSIQRAVQFVSSIGKTPVVSADRPGFIVNRILVPYMLEAAHLVEAGEDPKQIDRAMLDFGMPMGPLRLSDEVGLDIALDVAQTLADAFPERVTVPPRLTQMVEKGLLGRKSGQGFYRYHKGKPVDESSSGSIASTARNSISLQERMVYLMINEAARCLEEGVTNHAKWIDLAMVLGTGFAPFTGGPLRLCDTQGARRWLTIGVTCADEIDSRFSPSSLLIQHSQETSTFYED